MPSFEPGTSPLFPGDEDESEIDPSSTLVQELLADAPLSVLDLIDGMDKEEGGSLELGDCVWRVLAPCIGRLKCSFCCPVLFEHTAN